MDRDRRFAIGVTLAALAASFLLAGHAAASTGQLYILPHDDHGNLAFGELVVLVLFVALLIDPINELLLKPIFRVLDAREEKTAGTRRRADQLAAEAAKMIERYEDSVREVRRDAEETRKQALVRARGDGGATTAQARSESEREVAHARNEIAAALEHAREMLRGQAETLAREAAERTLGRPL